MRREEVVRDKAVLYTGIVTAHDEEHKRYNPVRRRRQGGAQPQGAARGAGQAPAQPRGDGDAADTRGGPNVFRGRSTRTPTSMANRPQESSLWRERRPVTRDLCRVA